MMDELLCLVEVLAAVFLGATIGGLIVGQWWRMSQMEDTKGGRV